MDSTTKNTGMNNNDILDEKNEVITHVNIHLDDNASNDLLIRTNKKKIVPLPEPKSDIMDHVSSDDIKRNITVIANKRTLYAYYRTGFGYVALALFSVKLFKFHHIGLYMGIAFLIIALIYVVFGYDLSSKWYLRALTGIKGCHDDTLDDTTEELLSTNNASDAEKFPRRLTGHEMACIRTRLANTRTFLAYQRTGMPCFILMMGEVKLEKISPAIVCGLMSLYFSIWGTYSWFKEQKNIDKAPPSLNLSSIRTSLANLRTWLSYLRTVFGFVALGLGCYYVFDNSIGHAFGITFAFGAFAMCFYALYSYLKTSKQIRARQELHQLALIRTVLANVRTYLANIRTFHPVAAFAFASVIQFDGWKGISIAMCVGFFGTLIWIYGGLAWCRSNNHILTDPSTHHLAIRRTELSNTRTFLASSRVCMGICVLSYLSYIHGHEDIQLILLAVTSFVAFLFTCKNWYQNNIAILSWLKAGVV